MIELPDKERYKSMEKIYLDNAATTKIEPEVLDAMRPYLEAEYANPSSAYEFAGKTHVKVEEARTLIANFLGAKSKEIFFTSGGSESDNWAIKGIADSLSKRVITLLQQK